MLKVTPCEGVESMAHFPAVYSDSESKILIGIYENPDMSYDTYWFTQHLHPNVSASSPEFAAAFKETLRAIEQLIVKGLIDGKQLKGAIGMYFSELKLKYKGKQEAIKERDRIVEFNKQLPKIIKQANAVAEEIIESQKKNSYGKPQV
jgi:hypothetical protein